MPIRVLIAAAASLTAAVHLYLVWVPDLPNNRALYALAAAGFIGSLGALILRLPRWMGAMGRIGLVATALGTIVGYVVTYGGFAQMTALAMTAKLDEAALIVLVIVDAMAARRASAARREGTPQSKEGRRDRHAA